MNQFLLAMLILLAYCVGNFYVQHRLIDSLPAGNQVINTSLTLRAADHQSRANEVEALSAIIDKQKMVINRKLENKLRDFERNFKEELAELKTKDETSQNRIKDLEEKFAKLKLNNEGEKELTAFKQKEDSSSHQDTGRGNLNKKLQTTINKVDSSPYSYVWIIGGVHEDKPAYKGFVWDILVSASLLRQTGSTADFWLLVRLSPESELNILPAEDLRQLDALGVQVRHLEKPQHESFSQLMYDKFFILNMTNYKRVMFLDADTIPLTNLDFYFQLSDPDNDALPTLLKPFFLFATRKEPSNGGMFMVEPSSQLYEDYKETVRATHERGKTYAYPHFRKLDGWGYNFIANNDHWEALNTVGKRWSWYGAHVDQGLMYYIAKILSKAGTSIAIGRRLQNWKHVNGEVKPVLESETNNTLETYQPPLLAYQYECDRFKAGESIHKKDFTFMCNPPYDSFAHFTGRSKPWQLEFQVSTLDNLNPSTRMKKMPYLLWFRALNELNQKHKMGIDFAHFNQQILPRMVSSTLGYMPLNQDQHQILEDGSKDLLG